MSNPPKIALALLLTLGMAGAPRGSGANPQRPALPASDVAEPCATLRFMTRHHLRHEALMLRLQEAMKAQEMARRAVVLRGIGAGIGSGVGVGFGAGMDSGIPNMAFVSREAVPQCPQAAANKHLYARAKSVVLVMLAVAKVVGQGVLNFVA